jgi:hypothetical protein
MFTAEGTAGAQPDERATGEGFVMCPRCGSIDYRSNLIDEAPFRQAARGAKMLRGLGHYGAAADVLTRLASARIINFIRLRWLCNACGAQFDE